MKAPDRNRIDGFSLTETLIATATASVMLAAIITTAITLQKSFNAVDNYFATHIQQVRIIDYLSRDVKRGLAVVTSVDRQTVTVVVPNYLIQPGDAEAVANPELAGTARTPTVSRVARGWQVNYGTDVTTVNYAVNGTEIFRTENGVVTTIASSTDQLVPLTTDVELANTEYSNTTVTFQPLFTNVTPDASRYGTTVCSTAYLRNRRRAFTGVTS